VLTDRATRRLDPPAFLLDNRRKKMKRKEQIERKQGCREGAFKHQ